MAWGVLRYFVSGGTVSVGRAALPPPTMLVHRQGKTRRTNRKSPRHCEEQSDAAISRYAVDLWGIGKRETHQNQSDKLKFVNPILFDSRQTLHPGLPHNSPALYKKHLFLHSKAVYQA